MLPAAARPSQYTNQLDRYFGPRSVGVPGTVAAFGIAHSRYGKKSWREVLEPARRLAKDGVPLSRRMEETIAYAAVRMRDYPDAARLFLKSNGTPLREGEWFVQPELANTIAQLQNLGWREFYRGEMAKRMVADLRGRGSLIAQQDWEDYEAQVIPPLRGSYRSFPILTMPPASSGGVALLEMLNILERFRLGEEAAGSADSWHLIIEAMKRADYDRRRWYRDAGLKAIEPEAILTKEYAREISSRIRLDLTTPSAKLSEGDPKPEQTTHFNVIDGEGNIVSNTYTSQGPLGSLVMPGNTGVLLSGAAAYFDAGSGNANDIGPRKRAIFSMSPTLVLRQNGKPWLALGLSGGARIPNVLLQLIVSVVDWGFGIRDAVDAPRIHQSYQPDEVLAERGAFSPEALKVLKSRGHRIVLRGLPLGEANAILIDEAGWRFGWADGRLGEGRALQQERAW
jgi:gamma-glutamyltranspeptidase/glutathione hydrolase